MSPPVTDLPALRAEHDATLARLSVRRSTLHFAHAAVALFVSATLGLAAWKLSTDLELDWAPALSRPAALISGVALLYAAARLFLGRRHLVREVAEFARLQGLRRALKLDEPPTVPREP